MSESIVVQKFGGTSVATPERRQQVVAQVRRALEEGAQVATVVSAMGRRGDPYATDTLLDLLRSDGGPVDPADYDLMFVCGETISVALMTQTLRRAGIPAAGLTAAQARIFTDGHHLESEVTTIETSRLRALMADGKVPVVCGGQGVTPGTLDFTTLGRGGSDTSGVALGVALEASRVDIFTDVEGILTADPRLVPGARLLGQISFASCHELARFGAKVVHPRALLTGWRAHLPITVRSTFSTSPGTRVSDAADELPVTGVALLPSMLTVPLGRIQVDQAAREQWERRHVILSITDRASGEVLLGAPPDKARDLRTVLEGLDAALPALVRERAWVSAVGGAAALRARAREGQEALRESGAEITASEIAERRVTFVVGPDEAQAAVPALHAVYLG